jgi:ubiquinone/menaquinone biosynthesis C-methylase UbiE/DNA-binding transcriptional ArsR family regulator
MAMSGSAMVGVLRAAGEPTRLRVLALLAHEELAVMELSQILGQSQPRVSRHLKLLADAGLIDRFPDGAWVFYRLGSALPGRAFVDQMLDLIDADDAELNRDLEKLDAVRMDRAREAAAYFARNAPQWDEIRSLYVDEADVETAILKAAGDETIERLIDLGTGAGRMLTLLGPRAESAIGIDLSQQMLNIARRHVAEAGLCGCELRHGDIFSTGLVANSGDLVVIHRVLHFLNDPGAALVEAARLVAPGGQLLIVDFAPHDLEYLRQAHQHRRLGFSDEEITRWLEAAGLGAVAALALPPASKEGLTVKVWSARKVGETRRLTQRSAA